MASERKMKKLIYEADPNKMDRRVKFARQECFKVSLIALIWFVIAFRSESTWQLTISGVSLLSILAVLLFTYRRPPFKRTIELSELGIRSTSFGNRLISWKDIKDIRLNTFTGKVPPVVSLHIDVKDNEHYLKQMNFFTRVLLRWIIKKTGRAIFSENLSETYTHL